MGSLLYLGYDKKNHSSLLYFVFGVMFIFFSVFLYSMYSTFNHDLPIVQLDAIDYVTVHGDIKIFRSYRSFRTDKKVDIVIHRAMYPEGDPANKTIIEGGIIDEKGIFTVVKSNIIPSYIKGRWCSLLEIEWKPFLSWVPHYFEGKAVCYDVP